MNERLEDQVQQGPIEDQVQLELIEEGKVKMGKDFRHGNFENEHNFQRQKRKRSNRRKSKKKFKNAIYQNLDITENITTQIKSESWDDTLDEFYDD